MTEALRLSVGLLTVLPVGRLPDVDRETAGRAMLWAPVVGLLLALPAAGVMAAATAIGEPPLLAATLAIGTLAVATRALHLDGLADTADGLGSRRPAEGALGVMRAGDVGPFGVTTLVITLLLQVTAVAAAGPVSLLVAVPTGRLAIVWACRHPLPAARPDGLGALVASTVARLPLLSVSLVVVAAAAGAGWRGPLATVVGVAASVLLVHLCVRRLSGITGDVLGAAAETASTVALVVLATA